MASSAGKKEKEQKKWKEPTRKQTKTLRTRPLFRRGYCDAGPRFVYYENRVYQSSNARLGEALDSSRFGDRQHCLGSQAPPRVLWGAKFRISSGHTTHESIGKVGTLNARVQR